MFDDDTLNSRNAEPIDDAAILALFREWCEARDILRRCRTPATTIPNGLPLTPAEAVWKPRSPIRRSNGLAGLAVKIYIETFT